MTGRDMISASLRLIGALAPGVTLDAQEATDGLATLNRLLASLSNEGLLIHAITAETPLTLTPGDGSVSLGTLGDITTRPISIEKAVIRDGSTDHPVRVLTLDEYVAIPDKTVQSSLPEALYDDGGHPQRTLTLYPIPSDAKQLVIFTLRELTQIASLDADISFPPGYERMLIFNLCLDLAPEYGRPVPDIVMVSAADSKASLKRTNHRPRLLRITDVPAGARQGRYNIETGGYTR